MKHKWLYIPIVLTLVLSFALTACGGTPEPTEAPTEEMTEEPTKEPTPEEASKWDEIQAEGTLVVGTSADYPPFEFVNEDNEYDGFDMVLIQEVGDRLGLEVGIQDISFDGLIAALKADQIDAIIAAMSATPERDEEVDFTINYYIGTDAILIQEGADIAIEEPADMAGYKIGVQAGTVHEEWVQTNLIETGEMDEADLSRYDRAELAISDLKNGRIDVVAMDYFAAKAYIEQGGIEMALEENLAGENMAIAVREGAAGLQWHLNQVIQEMWDDGTIDQLATEYLAEE